MLLSHPGVFLLLVPSKLGTEWIVGGGAEAGVTCIDLGLVPRGTWCSLRGCQGDLYHRDKERRGIGVLEGGRWVKSRALQYGFMSLEKAGRRPRCGE